MGVPFERVSFIVHGGDGGNQRPGGIASSTRSTYLVIITNTLQVIPDTYNPLPEAL
jgi:hypothetical protein